MTEHVELRLASPVPIDVFTTLSRIVATTYPGTTISCDLGTFIFAIPHADRPSNPAAADELADFRDELGLIIKSVRDGEVILGIEFLTDFSIELSRAMFKQFDAPNFIEQRVYDPESEDTYILTFQKASGKSPAQLLQETREQLQELTSDSKGSSQ